MAVYDCWPFVDHRDRGLDDGSAHRYGNGYYYDPNYSTPRPEQTPPTQRRNKVMKLWESDMEHHQTQRLFAPCPRDTSSRYPWHNGIEARVATAQNCRGFEDYNREQ